MYISLFSGNLNRHKKVKHGLNETTESMEEDAVNFLNELSERSLTNDDADVEEEESEQPESRSHRKGRKSTPRKYDRPLKHSIVDDDSNYSDQDDAKDSDFRVEVSSRYFSSTSEVTEHNKELRKRKRIPSRVSQSEEEFSNELSESDDDADVKSDHCKNHDSRSPKRQKTSKGAHLNSIIATKFNV